MAKNTNNNNNLTIMIFC